MARGAQVSAPAAGPGRPGDLPPAPNTQERNHAISPAALPQSSSSTPGRSPGRAGYSRVPLYRLYQVIRLSQYGSGASRWLQSSDRVFSSQ